MMIQTVYASNMFSGDTIPSRYRNYYYTEWYDECPAYQNGGRFDSCYYEKYTVWDGQHFAKYEYTEHSIKVKGIAALITLVPSHNGWNILPYSAPQYLYLIKRVDLVDTLRPGAAIQHFRAQILDSVRFDTIQPRYMEIDQGRNSDKPSEYCYVYEAYFDTPITVDSVFYLWGSNNNEWIEVGESGDRPLYKFMTYARIWPQSKTDTNEKCNSAAPPSLDGSHLCQTNGHWNSMVYQGYTDYSYCGYPVTGQPWLETSWHMPDDPYGLYLAIVENYKLDVYSDSLPMGDAEGSGIYYNSDGTEIRAIPHAGYVFSHWNDGSTDNPRIVYLTQDTSFTAYFDTGAYYNVQTAVTPAGWGTVEGGGTYAVNTEVELTAVPTEGFMFERWDDGDIQNPRTVTVTQDTLFTAVFALDTTTTGIPEAGRLAFGIAPNPTGGRLTVTLNESSPCEAEVYDATGRCVLRATLQGPQSDLDVRRLPAGRYTLRLTCGDKSGIKVFVRK